MQVICRAVNYLGMVCPSLQNLLRPICDLTRKGRAVFEDFKNRLLESFVLHLPVDRCRFQLFSDNSKTAAESALY